MEQQDIGKDSASRREAPQEAFAREVKDALEHLHDLGYLQGHPLARMLRTDVQRAPAIAGQRLRWHMIDGIEALNPGRGIAFRAPQARQYNLLTLHYVDGMTIGQTARELGISSRQALRGLRQGEQGLATVLWARCSVPEAREPDAAEITSLRAEVARLESHLRQVDVRMLVQKAQGAVEPLARGRGVHIVNDPWPARPLILSVDPGVAEQVLLSVLGRVLVQVEEGGVLHASMSGSEAGAVLCLSYASSTGRAAGSSIDQVVELLATRAGWSIREENLSGSERTIVLEMSTGNATVLVIDDNLGLINLLSRFLGDQTCQVFGATSGEEGLRLARELTPDAIILDVMMPGMHGWDVLQRLRMHPRTAQIPVIVCSVINNPELAKALGATALLSKPVRQVEVLTALHQLGVVTDASGSPPPDA